MDLKIIFAGNSTLIGRYEEGSFPIKGVLHDPREIVFGMDQQKRPIIGLQLLVGNPESIEVLNPILIYEPKDEVIINLYIKSTTDITIAKDLSNVRPIRGGNS